MVISLLLLVVGFILLIVGADKLVDGASSISRNLNIPNIVIGLTIVAFGTSAPELVVNVFSSLEGHTDMVMGNVLGSNIFNICAILGLAAIFAPLKVKRNTTWLEIPFNLLAVSALTILCLDMFLAEGQNDNISKADGLILIGFFIIFLVYNVELALKGSDDFDENEKKLSNLVSTGLLLLGLVGLIVGGKLIVDNSITIANYFGMSERVIGLTIVSVGTSLPELATSIVAVRKGKVDIAVGNVIGSNIFNIFFVLGISALLHSVPVPATSFIDLYLNIAIGLLLFIFVMIRGKQGIKKPEGIIFLAIYVSYLTYLLTA